jgi:hypothetical protein
LSTCCDEAPETARERVTEIARMKALPGMTTSDQANNATLGDPAPPRNLLRP